MSAILLLAASPFFFFFLSSVSATVGLGSGLIRSAIFLNCFTRNTPMFTPVDRLVFSVIDHQYQTIFHASIQNLRFNSSAAPKPAFVVTPEAAAHVRAAVICTKELGLEVRVRSGGHDYEGLSYKANLPFVLIDLNVNLGRVSVHPEDGIALVQSGATLGQLYYWIANKTRSYGFPAGTCSSIGVGGHFSGGGKGTLTRKYGLAADNVVDAVVVKADGEIVNREAMGEDLFWAIRGGGGGNFGIVVEWTIRLVPVPPKVTTFSYSFRLEEGATDLVHKWEKIAHRLDDNLFIRAIFYVTGPEYQPTITVKFKGLFLGTTKELLPVIRAAFPELGLRQEDCREMSWIESVVAFDNSLSPGDNIKVLLDRNHYQKFSFKAKSDFVTKTISRKRLIAIWNVMIERYSVIMTWDPFGGRMNRIPESETPFPHRAGNLFSIQYFSNWVPGTAEDEREHLKWLNRLYNFMGPFVSKNPRASYVNYRDLDLGVNGNGGYNESKRWGESYFKGNFERLVKIKGQVDPENFFRSEQSIPLPSMS